MKIYINKKYTRLVKKATEKWSIFNLLFDDGNLFIIINMMDNYRLWLIH